MGGVLVTRATTTLLPSKPREHPSCDHTDGRADDSQRVEVMGPAADHLAVLGHWDEASDGAQTAEEQHDIQDGRADRPFNDFRVLAVTLAGLEVAPHGHRSRLHHALAAVQHAERQLCAAPSLQSPDGCDGGDGCSDHAGDARQAGRDRSSGDYRVVLNGGVDGRPAVHLPLNDPLIPSIPTFQQAHVTSLSENADRQQIMARGPIVNMDPATAALHLSHLRCHHL